MYTRLIPKVTRISRVKFHCNRLTAVQDIQEYASLIFWAHIVHCVPKKHVTTFSMMS